MRVLAATLLGILMTTAKAEAACDCPVVTTQDQLELATYAFTGLVSDIRTDKMSGQKAVIFDVLNTYKGKPGEQPELTDFLAGTECQTDFKEGESYVVYARWQWGATFTSRCWGTKRLEDAKADANVLGPSDAWKVKVYDRLKEKCMGRRDTVCCLASLRAMSQEGYLLEPEGGCGEGTIPDRLRCAGSYEWCIPTTQSEKRQSIQ